MKREGRGVEIIRAISYTRSQRMTLHRSASLAVGIRPQRQDKPDSSRRLRGEVRGAKKDVPPGSVTMTFTADRIIIKEANAKKARKELRPI